MKKPLNSMFSTVRKGYDPKEVDAYISNQKASSDVALNEQKQRICELKAALAASEATVNEYKDKNTVISKAIVGAVAKADEIERLAAQKYKQEMERLKVFHDKWVSYYNRILQQYPLDDDLSAGSGFNRQISKILAAGGGDGAKSFVQAADNLERTFEEENERLTAKNAEKKPIVKAAPSKSASDDNDRVIRPKQKNASTSALLEDGFDPMARISLYLKDAASIGGIEGDDEPAKKRMGKTEQSGKPQGKTEQAKKQKPHSGNVGGGEDEEAASVQGVDYSDRSELGFSFQEALNPKDDLEQIMKDLGLFSDK